MNHLRRKLLSSSLLRRPFLTSSSPLPRRPRLPPPRPISQCRRFYYVDRHQVIHFRRRGGHRWSSPSPAAVLVIAAAGSLGFAAVYYGNLETVPYTKRRHVVLLSSSVERQLGEAQFRQLKSATKGSLLPTIHPDSIRVQIISKQIIDSLQRGLHRVDQRVWTDVGYSEEETAVPQGGLVFFDQEERTDPQEAVWETGEEGRKRSGEVRWRGEDEILDDSWVQRSRKEVKARGQGEVPATRHLEGLNWEVIVVKDPLVNAMCLPGGKIVVFTGLLEHFRTDTEIATIVGHEVGHAVARHVAEGITKNLWLILLQLILVQFFAMPDLINALSTVLLKFPFSRRMEMEADYIGLLLMASAGYDPRIAPSVYQKLGQITGDSELQNYLSTHPSSKKRAELLSRAHVMEEALNIHREALAGHGIEGFL